MKPLFEVVIHYVNGSQDRFPFIQFSAAQDFYRDGVSYSGDRVKRVEVDILGGGLRAIWDIDWDAQSKWAGLYH